MSRDTSFYYSFLVLPPRRRQAIVAVWDFCRAVDDAVDDVVEAEAADSDASGGRRRGAQRLAVWRGELDAVYAGTPATAQGRALQPFVREFGLPRAEFEALVEGVAMDLERARYPTFEALAEYCRRVASAVGLICIEIFGCRDPAAREYALNLGLALQLTNIIRDVAADLRQGRVYLPAEDLDRFHVGVEQLRAEVPDAAVTALLAFECARAREYYRRAAAVLPRAERRRLVAAEIMGAIYFAILERIERSGYDVLRRRIRVPRPVRAAIALRVWARAKLLG